MASLSDLLVMPLEGLTQGLGGADGTDAEMADKVPAVSAEELKDVPLGESIAEDLGEDIEHCECGQQGIVACFVQVSRACIVPRGRGRGEASLFE